MKIIERIQGEEIDLILKEVCEAVPEKKWVSALVYDIVLHDTQTIIGECSARIGDNENLFYSGHIGYVVNPEFRGKGYAGQSVKLLLNVFKENEMEKIYITNSPENISSRRVWEKLGAKFIGLFELPLDNEMRIMDGETHKNVFEISTEE